MARRVKGITIEIDGETKGLDKALQNVNKRSRDLQRELRDVDKLLKFSPGNADLLAQKQKLLSDAVENTSQKLEQLRSAQEQVNEQFAKGEIDESQYRAFQREITQTEQNLESLEKQLKDMGPAVKSLGDQIQDAGEKMQKAGDKMQSAGKKLSLGVTAPIVAVGAASTKAAIDFESAFAGVRKTVDATEEEFAQLEHGIREMAKQLPSSATDIAAVAEAAGQLGIETPNLLYFTEIMIGLGEATNLTAEDAATQFARFANIVGMSQLDFERLGSSVVALGNNFATTEAEIVAMGMRLAGQGAQIGLTEAQIMALATAMSSVGIEAEAGGTAMSTTLKKMQMAVHEGGASLDKFASVAGMSAHEFANAFNTEPIAALEAFIDGLAWSSDMGENLTAILNELGITGIRESDTLLRLAGASEVLSDAVSIATDAWDDNVALQEEVEQRYETTESKLKILLNQLKNLGIQIADILIPVIEILISELKPLVKWFSELDEKTKRNIVVVAALAAAIGPLLIVMGSLIKVFGSTLTLLPKLVTAVTALGTALKFLATNPIGLVITGIAAIIAGGIALWKNWDKVSEFAGKLWDNIKTVFGNIRDFILGVWDKIWSGIKWTINQIIKGMNALIRGLNKISFDVPDWVPGIGGKKFGFNISQIPLLAKGTDYFKGGLAIVGEEGPELVTLPRGSRVTPNAETERMLGGSAPEYIQTHVSVYLDSRQVAEAVSRQQQMRTRQTSRARGLVFP